MKLEGEEFEKEYMNLPPSKEDPYLKPKRTTMDPNPIKMPSLLQSGKKNHNSNKDKTKARLINKDLKEAIGALDSGFNMKNVCQAFNILKSSFRDHYEGKIKGRKMGPMAIFP